MLCHPRPPLQEIGQGRANVLQQLAGQAGNSVAAAEKGGGTAVGRSGPVRPSGPPSMAAHGMAATASAQQPRTSSANAAANQLHSATANQPQNGKKLKSAPPPPTPLPLPCPLGGADEGTVVIDATESGDEDFA